MNKTLKNTAGGFAIALGLGGCGVAPVAPSMVAADSRQVDASINQSLDRLLALQVIEVDGLVLNLPEEATSCYNLPCPGSKWVQPWEAERARQAPRLSQFADIAESVNADASITPRDMSESSAAIKALTGLAIVEVSGLVLAQPANNPDCYNLPCESDKQAAQKVNELRVAKVFAIVDGANRDGL